METIYSTLCTPLLNRSQAPFIMLLILLIIMGPTFGHSQIVPGNKTATIQVFVSQINGSVDDETFQGDPEIRLFPEAIIGGAPFSAPCNAGLNDVSLPFNTNIFVGSRFFASGQSLPSSIQVGFDAHEDDSGSSNCTYNGGLDDYLCNNQIQTQSITALTTNEVGGTLFATMNRCGGEWIIRFRITVTYNILNDVCANATTIDCGDIVSGSTLNSTNTEALTACNGPAGSGGADFGAGVWYTFEGSGDSMVLSTALPGTDFDTELQVWSGSCGNFTCVGGDDDGGGGLLSEIKFKPDLDSTYYVYVDGHFTATGAYELSLQCIRPANDTCGGALDYVSVFGSIGGVGSCGTNTDTLDFSTYSQVGILPTCDGFEDITAWYTWTATHTALFFNAQIGSPGLEILEGGCAGFTSKGCLNNQDGVIGGLTIGTEYHFLLWDDGSVGAEQVSWCMEAFNPPANDTCGGALDYVSVFGPIGGAGSCGTNTDTLDMSMYTYGDINATCDGPDITAWYTWTATHTSLYFNSQAGAPGLEILEGSCGSFASKGCLNNSDGVISDLTVGTEYHFLLWDDGTVGVEQVTWCMQAFNPPANDTCAGALDYTTVFGPIHGAGSCGTNTLDFSTYSQIGTLPTCDGIQDITAWYTWTATHTSLYFDSQTGSPGLEILEGSCGGFTSKGCLNNVDGMIDSLTVGTEYHFLLWDDGTVGAEQVTWKLTPIFFNPICGETVTYPPCGSIYQPYDTVTFTICPMNNDTATIRFTHFDLETDFDFVTINDNGVQIALGSGMQFLDSTFTASDTSHCLEVVFTSDNSIQLTGFSFVVENCCGDGMVTNTNDSGPGSLRDAVGCASNGDTITFASTIDGDSIKLTSGEIIIDKDLTILGNGRTNTIIDGSLNGDNRLFNVAAFDVYMFDMTFQASTFSGDGAAILTTGSDLAVQDCDFLHNEAASGGAIRSIGGQVSAVQTRFIGNKANPFGAALSISSSSHIIQCLFENNDGADVIRARVNSVNSIIQSTFVKNTNVGIFLGNPSTTEIHNSVFQLNGDRAAAFAGSLTASYNLVDDPGEIMTGVNGNILGSAMFVDTMAGDYGLAMGSLGIDQGDNSMLPIDSFDVDDDGNTMEQIDIDLAGNPRVINCNMDIGAFESPFTSTNKIVTNTNDSGAGSLRDVIACAMSGDTILFSNAIDGDSIKLTSGIIFISKKLSIIGNGIGQTVIDGSLTDDILFIPISAAGDVLFRDMTLQHGGGPTLDLAGGCMEVLNNASVQLVNCHLFANESSNGGGALIANANSKIKASNCIFEANKTSGAGGVGIIQVNSTGSFTQCLIFDNEASTASGLFANGVGDSLNLVNCTFSQNKMAPAVNQVQSGSSINYYNNITHNNDGGIALGIAGTANLNTGNNLVDLPGSIPVGVNGNFVGNPAFVDTLNNNFTLQDTSDAIDAGDAMFLPIDSCDVDADGNTTEQIDIDLAGNPRIATCRVDIGAYENQAIPFCPPVNDACGGAIALPAITSSCTLIAANTESATDSGTHPACDDFGTNIDLWYSFQAPSSGSVVLEMIDGTASSIIEAAIWDACGGNVGDEVFCDADFNDGEIVVGLSPSATYYLQFWIDDFNAQGDFQFCLKTGPPPPPNDTCGGAIDYATIFGQIGAAGSCPGNMDTLDMSLYSDNGIDPTCNFGIDATAWYTWTAVYETISFNSGLGAPGLEILEGNCGSFTSMGCLNNTSGIIGGLTIGTTYYLLIWDETVPGASEVTWCIEEDETAINDECENAIMLPPVTSTCQLVTVNTFQASNSVSNTCSTFEDLWYSFIAPPSGAIEFEHVPGVIFNNNVATIFESCDSMFFNCALLVDGYTIAGLTPDSLYLLSVGSFARDSFKFCIKEIACTDLGNDIREPICGDTVTYPACLNYPYENFANDTFTICPSGNDTASIRFTYFDTESGYDFVDIFDNGISLGSFSGLGLPDSVFTASDTGHCLTVIFTSDDIIPATGFRFIVENCGGCPPVLSVNGTPTAGSYFAENEINSDATIENPKGVIYQAGDEILLNQGFEVELGAEFEAVIGDCP